MNVLGYFRRRKTSPAIQNTSWFQSISSTETICPAHLGESCFGPIFRLWAHFLGRWADLPNRGGIEWGTLPFTLPRWSLRRKRPDNRRSRCLSLGKEVQLAGQYCGWPKFVLQIAAFQKTSASCSGIIDLHHRSSRPCFDAEKGS